MFKTQNLNCLLLIYHFSSKYFLKAQIHWPLPPMKNALAVEPARESAPRTTLN